ncbi:MAG: AraC family transcriptional regulator [Vicinamibacterales bacterium]
MERQLRSDLHAPGGVEARITPDSPRHVIDVTLFASPLLRIGRWRCPAGHHQFRDSGPASDTLFAFPRESVRIRHEGGDEFGADANTVTYYNKGQRYRRTATPGWGDRCEWFAFQPEAVAAMLAACDPAARDRLDRLFPFTHGPADVRSFLAQRRVFDHVSREGEPDRLFVEETMLGVLERVATLAYERRGAAPVARGPGRRQHDLAEAARELIAERYFENLSLSEIAMRVGASMFHLSRVFRRRTGFSLHRYRTHLRLRAALDLLAADPERDLSALALGLGFSSHSHFTDVFRRTFGRPPSAMSGHRCVPK